MDKVHKIVISILFLIIIAISAILLYYSVPREGIFCLESSDCDKISCPEHSNPDCSYRSGCTINRCSECKEVCLGIPIDNF